MSARRPVAVVMLTWNARAFTETSLEALRTGTDHPAWRMIVVDNGSTDGTAEWLGTLDWLTFIPNGSNLGFSKGCNIGIAASTPDEDIVLINNDVTVTDPQWLNNMQDVAYSSPTVGVVGSRQVNGAGLICHLGSYMQPLTLRGQQMGGMQLDINQCARDRVVESVVFAQAYIRRDCIERVGLLDEDLFAYFEDTDYCMRAHRAGFDVMYAGLNPPTIHRQNTSTRENKVDFWSIYNRSQKVFRRNWGEWFDKERHQTEMTWHSVLHRPMGYAAQSRKLMEAFHFADIKVAYRNAYGDSEEPTGNLLIDDLTRRRPDREKAQVAFCQADAFPAVSGQLKVGWSMLEVTGLPASWADGCNSMDEVWVPASFNVETFKSSGVSAPIRVMPLGVDVDYFHPAITGFRPSSRFTFLSVFEWGERKAPELLLRAFAEEFKKSEDVVLMLSVINRDPSVDVERQIAELDLGPCAPIVLMLNPELSDYQMGSLYRSADCFVLPTRGEGWGMPVLEAMACGLPTIATNWSGPADFLDESVGYPIEVKTLEKAEARCPYYEGFEWALPDFDNIRFLMRQVFDAPDRAREKGLAAAERVAAEHTWEQTARRVKQRLLDLS